MTLWQKCVGIISINGADLNKFKMLKHSKSPTKTTNYFVILTFGLVTPTFVDVVSYHFLPVYIICQLLINVYVLWPHRESSMKINIMLVTLTFGLVTLTSITSIFIPE